MESTLTKLLTLSGLEESTATRNSTAQRPYKINEEMRKGTVHTLEDTADEVLMLLGWLQP
jgi:hypothetical protein